MAIRPILDIDIDPEKKLEAYVAKYKEYEEALRKTPGVWADASKAANDTATAAEAAAAGAGATAASIGETAAATAATVTGFEAGVAALLTILDISQSITAEEKKKAAELAQQKREAREIYDYTHRWERRLGIASYHTKKIAGDMFAMVKWASIGTAAAGVVGLGGLWGLEHIIGAVGAGRRSSMGLGLSYGEQKAFGTDLGRLVDPGSFLSGTNEALSDVTKRRYLYSAGLSASDIEGKDTAQVSTELLTSIKSLVDQTNPAYLGNLLTSRGLGQFGLGVEDLRRLKATPQSELGEFIKEFQTDKKAFGLDDKTQRQYQDLNRTLFASKNMIETALVRGLAPLAPELTKLSGAAAKLITDFLGSKDVKQDLKDFATYIGSPDFKSDIKDFTGDVGSLAHAVSDALHALGKHSIKDAAFGAGAGFLVAGAPGAAVGAAIGGGVGNYRDHLEHPSPGSPAARMMGIHNPQTHKTSSYAQDWQMNSMFRSLGWSPQAAAALQGNAAWESGGDPDQWGDNGKAYGLFQWHKPRWDDYAKWAKDRKDVVHKTIFGSTSLEQMMFATHELKEGKEKRAGDKLAAAKDVDEAARIVNSDYERPANPAASNAQRTALAKQAMTHKVKSDVKVSVKVQSAPGANPIVSASTTSLPQ